MKFCLVSLIKALYRQISTVYYLVQTVENSVMHIQVINFELNIPHADYNAGATDVAQVFADMPGLISKHWLGDEENKIYGGVYFWESKEVCEAYKAGPVFADVMSNDMYANQSSKDYGVLDDPTSITA